MTPRPPTLSSTQRLRGGKCAPLGSPAHERLMLLELATDLQNWPARNLVFRTALDRAAEDIVRMAGGAEQA